MRHSGESLCVCVCVQCDWLSASVCPALFSVCQVAQQICRKNCVNSLRRWRRLSVNDLCPRQDKVPGSLKVWPLSQMIRHRQYYLIFCLCWRCYSKRLYTRSTSLVSLVFFSSQWLYLVCLC